MMKYLYILFLIVFFPILTFGQNEYFSTDRTTSTGIKLLDGGDLINSKLCQVKKGDKIIEYSPYEVKEFGFNDGRVYVSREIKTSDSTKRVFLERLYEGKTTLYYYKERGRKSFFIEKDSSLFVELPKKSKEKVSFNDQLLDFTSDCKYVADATKLVRYNKKSLSKLIYRFNNCELKPFPFVRYGVTFGYEFAKLKPTLTQDYYQINKITFKYDGGYIVGLFSDIPILMSDFSLHTELNYSRHGFSGNKLIDNKDINLVVNFSSIKLPIMIKYAYPSNQFRPFINVGVVSSHNFMYKNHLYETTFTNNIIEYNETEKSSYVGDYHLGYSIGGGIEYKLNFRNSIFFEIRYDNLYRMSNSSSTDISAFKFMASINL